MRLHNLAEFLEVAGLLVIGVIPFDQHPEDPVDRLGVGAGAQLKALIMVLETGCAIAGCAHKFSSPLSLRQFGGRTLTYRKRTAWRLLMARTGVKTKQL